MIKAIKISCCFFILLFCIHADASVILPKVIGSNMVLQRNAKVAIWGKADPGENISVSFHKQLKTATANEDGKWIIHLDAMPADAMPATMIIKGNNTIQLENILVGEVWLCSGQSNMQYTMTKSTHYAHAKNSNGLDSAQLAIEKNDYIRLFLVVRDLTKPDGGGVNKGWNAASGAPLGAFSAAGYHFAKNLYQELNVPVGIIASSVSGSNIDPWLEGTLVTDSAAGKVSWRMDKAHPGKFYLGMISPLAPFTIKGFLWYQGETNCFLHETDVYSFKFVNLINTWRSLFYNENAPFYFVQIAPFYYSKSKGKVLLDEHSLPEFREAQAAALKLPHTGMVVTTDLNDNLNDLHPAYKWEIGRRLALLALAHDYQKKMEYSGPLFSKMKITGNCIEIDFAHAGKGLVSKDGKTLSGFEIAGADGNYVPAEAVIRDGKLFVSAGNVSSPKNVRFAWNEAAQPNLFNKDGLPAVPFRTDHVINTTVKNQ
jgi:sialate O-acetylesterase